MGRENIKSNRILFIRWINKNHIFDTCRRNDSQNLVHQIAVWVENSDSVAILDVLADEVVQECGFARSRNSDDVRVTHPLLVGDSNGDGFPCMIVRSQQ